MIHNLRLLKNLYYLTQTTTLRSRLKFNWVKYNFLSNFIWFMLFYFFIKLFIFHLKIFYSYCKIQFCIIFISFFHIILCIKHFSKKFFYYFIFNTFVIWTSSLNYLQSFFVWIHLLYGIFDNFININALISIFLVHLYKCQVSR